MKRKKKSSVIAGFLAGVMMMTQVLELVPSLTVNAAPVTRTETFDLSVSDPAWVKTGTFEAVEEGGVVWHDVKAGANNNNADNPAVLLNTNAATAGMSDGTVEMTIKPVSTPANTRFGLFVKYVDATHYVYAGYNGSGWYWQYQNGTDGSYGSYQSAPAPAAGETVDVKAEFAGTTLKFYLNGVLKGTNEIAALSAFSNPSVGLRAATYGGAVTEIQFANTVIKKTVDGTTETVVENGADTWALASTASGETFTTAPAVPDATWLRNTGAAAALYPCEMQNGSVEAVLRADTAASASKAGIALRYVDADNWVFAGYDTTAGWYYEYKVNGTGNYGYFTDAATPAEGTETAVKVALEGGNLTLYLDGVSKGTKELGDAVAGMAAGQIGFQALNANTGISVNAISYTKIYEAETTEYVNNFDTADSAGTFRNIGNVPSNATFTTVADEDGGYAMKAAVGADSANKTIMVDSNSGMFKNGVIEFDVTPESDGTRFGTALRATGNNSLIFIGCGDSPNQWFYEVWSENGNSWSSMFEGPALTAGTTRHIKVKLLDTAITLWVDETKVISASLPSAAPTGEGYFGLYKLRSANSFVIDNLSIREIVPAAEPTTPENITTITSEKLTAAIDQVFPRVKGYTYHGTTDKNFYGQTESIYGVKINGLLLYPQVTFNGVSEAGDSATYTLTAKDTDNDIDAVIDVKISVADNDLTYEITKVQNNIQDVQKINTIEIPELNLVSVKSTQAGAAFKGTTISGNTTVCGDSAITFDSGFTANETAGYAYAFVSADGLSAGIWSNSEAPGDKRVTRNNTADTISLASSLWYYQVDMMGAPQEELPCTKVCITPDVNDDGAADWQDGAIEYRDIMNNPLGSEDIPELVNYRIVMNFSSQATNPFLKSADNIKKVYLATDGLGQAVMLKGYANEGHDSGHSDYGDIGERIGGATDMNTLIDIAHEYDAQIGVHINAQETYPEADMFSEELINGRADGWDWLDPSYTINRNYDLSSGARAARLQSLKDQVPEMDFIYLDVWYGDSWETRRIAEQINNLGWRFSTEFGTAGEYNSTWQHWATEASYGGAASKGINSEVIRFIRNHQKDSFVLNHPPYSGTADNPLLGGAELTGFEGWTTNNFDNYIVETFTDNVPAKFLQHYEVTNWTDYAADDAACRTANKEKEIALKNDEGDKVVVTRNVGTVRNDSIIERTITLNGVKVLEDDAYLLPWADDAAPGGEKLYHFNYDGGETTWELPAGWNALENVKIYQLADEGKINEQTLPVTNGAITFNATAKTPYVVYQGTAAEVTVEFGTGSHVTDPGFNSNGLFAWTATDADGAASVQELFGDEALVIGTSATNVSLSQTITGLTPGKGYVAQVYVDNRSDAAARIAVTNGTEIISNYTMASIAQNFVKCDAHNRNLKSQSMFQIMLVSFTAAGETATLTLSRDAGTGKAYFDDIRIIEKTLTNKADETTFVQDFETVAQGCYPFVFGPAQGVTDHRTHLSEKHAPYTQKGWGGRVTDDVLEGNWSLKNHDSSYEGVIYKTIPQNFRFEPGVTYTVSFDYQTGLEGGYAFVTGDGTGEPAVGDTYAQALNTTTYTTQITGSSSGQTWFGIYGTTVDGSGNLGQQDFILDNLRISVTSKKDLQAAYNQYEALSDDSYEETGWAAFAAARDNALAVLEDTSATDEEIQSAQTALVQAQAALVTDPVKAFVVRLYEKVLGRTAAEEEISYYTTSLTAKDKTGADVGRGFVFSPEFTDRALSNADYVEVLYETFMGRTSDAEGKAYWTNYLDNGVSRYFVFRGFVESPEYTDICSTYGIERGTADITDARDMNVNLTMYVNRLYREALGREAEENGLNYYAAEILAGRVTAIQAAQNFICSSEFRDKNLEDDDYVKVLYRTFMGREFDQSGLEYHMERLSNGVTREDVLLGFAMSSEFDQIMSGFGVK
ncbi:endo-alpha-N-acetylgalactosaminidase family protein [Anaerobium acetethylicum]|uniref:Endo-alpha-N-acetylgalactosaminidase n=1 Tax=Anaerobium acetethylicum TaxID=1619234 RepID=A0A1D3TSC2_9FIRM|nr:endo-alpha-N-acetylgalactosaminidase family protein [Anaerobium acetethylicum]SCP96723.1 protein of unknown function [Anaerobium acetethylicum]